ncbi:MAG: recombination regulator RecX [Neisseriaceae bacterium]|nr:recombination regulator RecX [Neisseriaceae bacterium]
MTYSKTFRQPEPLSQKELYNKALDYLSRREYTRYELQQKLAQYTDNQDDIASVLNRLQEKNLQSDKRFSENFIHSKQQKYGNGRLIENLKQKGVHLQDASEFLPDKETQLATAIAILHKKLGTPRHLSANEQQKAYRFLQYRGFSGEIIHNALKMWEKEEDDAY